MLNISNKFRELAAAGGREPFCVIKAGDRLFFDDSIKSFELQEVIFPEELTFGTACSARFQFRLYTEENIPLSAEIRPYIGFGEYSEESELCPLGVFYISRRYRRLRDYSVTCYDRMYRLEDKYSSKLAFPASASQLLQEICEEHGLEFAGECGDSLCGKMPANESVRNVLGYLAGLEGCCARFDRYGRLCFRKISDSGYRITRDNYTSMDLKQDPMEVEKIVVSNDEESFEKGKGSKLNTYEVYNPFADEQTAAKLYGEFGGFYYYGLELDMQGLPYLEAGDIVTVQNDTDDGVFTAVIGELDFVYDGSFWANLSSRSKNPVEDSEDMEGQEEQLRQLEGSLQTVYYGYRSDKAVSAGSVLTNLATVDIQALDDTSAVVGAQLIARAQSDCTLTLTLTVEDRDIPPPVAVTLKAGEIFPICLHNFLQTLGMGYITVSLYGRTDGGSVSFGAGDVVMTVYGQGLAASTQNRSPNRTLYESFMPLTLERSGLLSRFQEQAGGAVQIPRSAAAKERICLPLHNARSFLIGFTDSVFAPEKVHHARIYADNNVVYCELVFCNPVFTQDAEALAGAFAIRVYFDGEQEEYGVSQVQWDGNAVLTLISDAIFVGESRVRLLYDAGKGDLICPLTGGVIESFEIYAATGEGN